MFFPVADNIDFNQIQSVIPLNAIDELERFSNSPGDNKIILTSLFALFKYLENKQTKQDNDQKYRRQDFAEILYGIINGNINTFGELEDVIYKHARVANLTKGYSKDYYNLSITFLNAALSSDHDFTKFKEICKRFTAKLTDLSHRSFPFANTLFELAKALPVIPQINEPPTSALADKLIDFISSIQSNPTTAALNTIESFSSDITIKTLIFVTLYNNKINLPDEIKRRALARLNKISITTIFQLNQPTPSPIDYANKLITFGENLAHKETGFKDKQTLITKMYASNNEALRLIFLGAIIERDDSAHFNMLRQIHHRSQHKLPFGEFLTTEMSRCLYVDLMNIQVYFGERAASLDLAQMIRRKDFVELICRIHYGLIKDTEELRSFLHADDRKKSLLTGFHKTYYNLTDTFFQRITTFYGFAEVKNACDEYVKNSELKNNLGVFRPVEQNGELLRIMQNIERIASNVAIIPFNKINESISKFIPAGTTIKESVNIIHPVHYGIRLGSKSIEPEVYAIVRGPRRQLDNTQYITFIKNLIEYALYIPDDLEAFKYFSYANFQLNNTYPNFTTPFLMLKAIFQSIVLNEIGKRRVLLKMDEDSRAFDKMVDSKISDFFSIASEFAEFTEQNCRALDILDSSFVQFQLAANNLQSTDALFKAFGKLIADTQPNNMEKLLKHLFDLNLHPRLKVVCLKQLVDVCQSNIDLKFNILFHVMAGSLPENNVGEKTIQVGDAIRHHLKDKPTSLNYFIKLHEVFIYLYDKREINNKEQEYRRADFAGLLRFILSNKCQNVCDLHIHLNDRNRKQVLTAGISKKYFNLVGSLTSSIDNKNIDDMKLACEQYMAFLTNYHLRNINDFCEILLTAKVENTNPGVSQLGLHGNRNSSLNLNFHADDENDVEREISKKL